MNLCKNSLTKSSQWPFQKVIDSNDLKYKLTQPYCSICTLNIQISISIIYPSNDLCNLIDFTTQLDLTYLNVIGRIELFRIFSFQSFCDRDESLKVISVFKYGLGASFPTWIFYRLVIHGEYRNNSVRL